MLYDFDSFLSGIKYLERDDILAAAYKQHKVLDKSSSKLPVKARLDLQNSIQGLLYWMETGERPQGMHDRDFMKLKPLCENLIRIEQLDPRAIELFTAATPSL